MIATMAPEREDITELLPEFSIPCDGPRVWPEAIKPHDTAARWVGLKSCGHHRLLCDDCKDFYLKQIAKTKIAFTCAECGERSGSKSNFMGFELLNGKA